MGIWFKDHSINEFQEQSKNTIAETLGIELTELTEDTISGKMPIDERTIQPAGILHGGASVVLAETLGSIASNMVVDSDNYYCVGLEINANHIRPGIKGNVYGTASAIHIGRSTHLWKIEIKNEDQKLVCISRLTVMVRAK